MHMLPRAPGSFTIAPDNSDLVQERIDTFFQAILDFLGYDQRAKEAFCDVEVKILHAFDKSGSFQPIDDRITSLRVMGSTVATVLEQRNDRNYIEARFAHYLSYDIIARLARIKANALTMRTPTRVDMTGCQNAEHLKDLRAALAMTAAIDLGVHRGSIAARSPAADARLNHGNGVPYSEREAIEILAHSNPSFR
jgi:hypothetical protein